jgi:hypothetical protein
MGMGPGGFPNPFQYAMNQLEGMVNAFASKVSEIFSKSSEAVTAGAEAVTNSEVIDNAGSASDLVEGVAAMKNLPKLRAKSGAIGNAIDLGTAASELVTTDFTNTEEIADFVEGTVQTVVENIANLAGPAVTVILEDGKKDDGVTNVKNMPDNFKQPYRTSNAYIYMNFTLRNQQAAEKRKQANAKKNDE